MRTLTKTLVLVLIAALSGLTGLTLGYFRGAEDWAGYTASSEAVATVTTLKELREKRIDEAIRLLESELDTQVAKRAIYEQSIRPIALLSTGANDEKLVRIIAHYRRDHPSKVKDEAAQRLMDELLEKYR